MFGINVGSGSGVNGACSEIGGLSDDNINGSDNIESDYVDVLLLS